MRGALIIGLAISLGLGVAEAATKKSAVSKKRVYKTDNQRFGLIAATTSTSEQDPTAVTGTAAGATTAPINTITQEAAPKRWGLLIDVWNENNIGATNNSITDADSDTQFTAYTLVRPSYKIQDDMSVALGLEAAHGWGTDAGNDSRFELTDPYFMVAHSNLGSIGSAKAKAYARLYMPFSESSQDKGQIAMLRVNSGLKAPVAGTLSWTGNIEGRAFFQSEDSYEHSSGEIRNNQWGRLRVYTGFEGTIAGPLSFYSVHGMQFNQFYDNPSAVKKTTADQYGYINETMLGVELSDNFTLLGGLSDWGRPTNEAYALYSESTSMYVVEAVASF